MVKEEMIKEKYNEMTCRESMPSSTSTKKVNEITVSNKRPALYLLDNDRKLAVEIVERLNIWKEYTVELFHEERGD